MNLDSMVKGARKCPFRMFGSDLVIEGDFVGGELLGLGVFVGVEFGGMMALHIKRIGKVGRGGRI